MASFATLAGSTLPRPPTSNSAGPSPPIPVCPPLEDINVHDLHHVEVHEEELLRELPWWKLILVHPGYRARLTYLATEAYQAELFLLRNRPEELTSTQGMLERQVMAQYVYVDATDLFSTRHPNAMIQRSGIAQLRRVALGCMPPAANDAERQRQVWAVEDHLKHKRRASLLSTRHEKKRNAQDILDGITPLPDPLSLDIVASPTPSRNTGVEVASRRFLTEEAEEALYTFPPRPPSPYGWTEMVEQVEARAATRKKVPTYLGAKMDAQGNEIPRRPVDEQGHFLILPEDQQVRLTRSALACIDGTTNLYGLTYFWDMPLPPSGFIRIAPDPRMAMWPDDLREEEKKDASERRKETEERLIRRVNERNRKLMQMRQYGRHIKYEELLMDEDDDDEEADAAARALAEVRRDPRDEADKEKPRPTFDGPLNINVYLSIPRRAPSSSSSLSPAAAAAAAASAKPRRLFLGTYRQSRLLLHYKIFCRALHEEHRLRCGAALTHVGGTTPAEMEPPTLNRNHGGYEAALGTSPTLAEETALLANVPRIPFPVLQVQQESPQLRMSMDRRTPSLATVQPARCWEGLCPMPPPDPTSVATHVWKYLHQASLLVQQSLRDIFFSLPRDAEDRLPKKAYVEFVLDLLHLFFPTHLTEMHVAVAEEEWIYRGTSDNVGFDTFFERFFSFPFIFLRDIASVSEQDYVEVWTLIRVCLFEEEATMPMLLPYRRAATATTTTSDGVGSRRGGGIGTRTTTSAMAMAKSPAAPPPLRPRTHSGRDYAAAVADAANHRRDVEGHGISPFHHAHHASRRETHAHASSSASTCSDATPRDTPRRLTPITPSSASSTRKRRLSLLSPVDGLTPAQLAHLYCTDFRHEEDYDLHLAEAEVWKKDELVRCARPESQRRLVRQRGQELVAKQRSVEADLRAQQIHEREERQRERHLLEIHSMEQHMEEMCKAAGLRYGTHSSANSSNSTSPTASGASGQHIHHHRAENSHGSYVSRSKQVEIAAAMRRQLIDQMEADRQRAALLSESYRYQERSRRIHAAYVQVLSAVDATSSSWELHHDDVFSPPALTDGIEDRLIRYVKDLDDEVFAGRVSLRERFLVCEGFRRQREKLRREQLESVRRQGRAISPPLVAELERPGSNNNNNNNVVGGPPTEGGKSIGDLYVEAMSADDALAQGPRYTTSGITLAALPVVSSRESPDAAASNLHSDLRTFESYAAGAYPFRPTAVEDPTKIALRVEDVSPDSTWNTFNMTSPLHATIVRRRVKKTSPSLRASGSDRDLSDDDDDDFDDGLGGRRSLGSSRRSFRSPILSPPSEYLSDGCFGHDYIPIGMPPQASAAATGSVVPPVVVLPLALTNPSLYAADKNRLHPSPRRSTEIASGRPPLRPNTARPGTATTAAAAAVANNTLLTPITSAAIASILSVGGMADSAPLQLVSDDLLRSTSARSDYSTHLISPATQGSFSASRSRAPQHASASSSQQPQPRRHHKKPTSPPPPPPISVPASVAAAVQKLHERAEEEDVGEAQRPRRPASGIHAYAREVDEKLGIGDAVVEQTGYNLRPVRQKYGVVPTTKDDDEDDEDAMAAASAAEKMVSMRSPRQMMATPQALAEAAKLSLARTPQDAMAWATTDEDLALRLHTWQDRQRRFQQDRRRAAPKESFISPAPPRSMRTNNNNTSRSTSPGRVVEELPSRRSPTTTTSVRGQAELGAAPYCGYRVFDKARLLDRPQVTYIKRSSRR